MRKFMLLMSVAGLSIVFSLSLHAALAAPADPASPAQDGTLPALTAIAGQGMMSNEAYSDLEELSDYIGGRVTGSPQAGGGGPSGVWRRYSPWAGNERGGR